MSRSTALGLLSKAQTGNDILTCLAVIESLTSDDSTINEIADLAID